MSYSIKPILHHVPDKNGLHKIQMLIIYQRIKITMPTDYRVKQTEFLNGRCTGFKNANTINKNLVQQKENYERILLNVIETKPDKNKLKELFTGTKNTDFKTLYPYAIELIHRLDGKLSAGRLSHYKTVALQLKDFGDIELNKVSPVTAVAFEKYLRALGLENNTINSKMKLFNAVVKHAIIEKLIKPDCLFGYKKPKYIQPIPDYLTEEETDAFKKITDAVTPVYYKTAGYYYLLSCYAGYRISNLSNFKYEQSVKEDNIIIRAKKNKEIVSIPVYPKLKEILDKIKDLPFYFTEQSMRKYVKELALLAGLGRKIKVHTARHTFAMMLIEKGFSIEKVAELLGDSVDVARIYARVNPKALQKEIKERLG